jgi:hypothetical protein
MRNLLLVAALCVGMLATAANGKEIVPNNFDDVNIENINFLIENDVEFVTITNGVVESDFSDELDFFGCGADGNSVYDAFMATGQFTHREARRLRRAFVQDCRGIPGGWISCFFNPDCGIGFD